MTVSIIHSTQGICNYILEKEVKKDGKWLIGQQRPATAFDRVP